MKMRQLIQFFRRGWFAERSGHPLTEKLNEAEAVILDVLETGRQVNHLQQLKLLVQVTPEKGRSFVTEIFTIPGKQVFQSGLKIKIRYQLKNRRKAQLVSAV